MITLIGMAFSLIIALTHDVLPPNPGPPPSVIVLNREGPSYRLSFQFQGTAGYVHLQDAHGQRVTDQFWVDPAHGELFVLASDESLNVGDELCVLETWPGGYRRVSCNRVGIVALPVIAQR